CRAGGFGHRTVEDVGQRGEDQQNEAEAKMAGTDRDRRRDGHEDAENGEVVRGEAGALELGSHRPQRSLGVGPETAVEPLVSNAWVCLLKFAPGGWFAHFAQSGTLSTGAGSSVRASQSTVEIAPVLGVLLGEP